MLDEKSVTRLIHLLQKNNTEPFFACHFEAADVLSYVRQHFSYVIVTNTLEGNEGSEVKNSNILVL
jgi:hypothetical protein